MNIYEVRDNLIKTIEGKEAYLEEYLERLCLAQLPEDGVVAFLKINIDELKKILKDVTICCTQETEKSWLGVDRQGGI